MDDEHWRRVNWGSLDTALMVWGMAQTYADLEKAKKEQEQARADTDKPGTSKVQDMRRLAAEAVGATAPPADSTA